MSARRKARIVGTLLVAIALWPLVHRQLVTRLDVDPWKLYGFAMYCTPHAVVVDRDGTCALAGVPAGTYTLRVGDPDTGEWVEHTGLRPVAEVRAPTLQVGN